MCRRIHQPVVVVLGHPRRLVVRAGRLQDNVAARIDDAAPEDNGGQMPLPHHAETHGETQRSRLHPLLVDRRCHRRIEQGRRGKGVLQGEIGADQQFPLGRDLVGHLQPTGDLLIVRQEDVFQVQMQVCKPIPRRRQQLGNADIVQTRNARDHLAGAVRAGPEQTRDRQGGVGRQSDRQSFY